MLLLFLLPTHLYEDRCLINRDILCHLVPLPVSTKFPILLVTNISVTVVVIYCYLHFSKKQRYDDDDDEEGHGPDQYLEQGMPLPIRMSAAFDPDLAGIPLEDFDPYYQNIAVI